MRVLEFTSYVSVGYETARGCVSYIRNAKNFNIAFFVFIECHTKLITSRSVSIGVSERHKAVLGQRDRYEYFD